MNTIKIYLAESGRIADLHKDFPLYQGQFQDKLVNVFVPTSILAPQFDIQHYIGQISGAVAPTTNELNAFVLENTYPQRESSQGDIIEFYNSTDNEFFLYTYDNSIWVSSQVDSFGTLTNIGGTNLKLGMTAVKRNGTIYTSKSYFMRYLKTLTYQGVEYALYERKLPKEFTSMVGQGQNAPTIIANVVNIDTETKQVLSIVTSQTCQLDVMTSTMLDNDEIIEASELENLEAQVNENSAKLLLKQNIIDNGLLTTQKTVVGAINEIKGTADTNTTGIYNNSQDIVDIKAEQITQNQDISANTHGIETNTTNIENLQSRVSNLEQQSGVEETYIGQMTGAVLPTNAQLNQFVLDNANRAVQGGDVIIFLQTIPDATDKVYKYTYSIVTHAWSSYEIPATEPASNTSKGIVQGSYSSGTTQKTQVNIVGGEIEDIYIVDNSSNKRRLAEYLNTDNTTLSNTSTRALQNEHDISVNTGKIGALETSVANIVDGTTTVGKATNATNDGLGNNISTTYLTNNAGVTKTQMKDYALPRVFNDVSFFTNLGYSGQVPTDPAPIHTLNTSEVGDFEMFSAEKTFSNVTFQLASKNSYTDTLFASASINCAVQFRLTTDIYVDSNWVTANVELSDEINMVAGQVKKLSFASTFNSLTDVYSFANGSKIRQTFDVITQTSQAIQFLIYSNDVYPSTFYLNTTSQTIILAQGKLGELPIYNIIGSGNSTKVTFTIPIDANIENNVEAMFILQYSGTTANSTQLELSYNSQTVQIITPANNGTANPATVETMLSKYASNYDRWVFTGVFNVNNGNISVIADIDNILPFLEAYYTKTQIDTFLNGKQATLTTAQLNAVNSGIDTTKVGQITTNTSNIATNTANITSNTTAIGSNTSSINSLSNRMTTAENNISAIPNNYVSYSTAQTLNDTQKAQARANIGASGTTISYADLTNKPALDTTATTAQSTSASETISGTIKLHKVAKTGTASDLIGYSDLAQESSVTNLANRVTDTESAISTINGKIPSAATTTNQLADKQFVNSSISTATATFRGTYNLVSDLSLTTSATESQIATAIATKLTALSITPDNNDYCFVQIPTADATPTQIAQVQRFKYNGTTWAFEYALNNSGFTASQWAAINSGLSSTDKTKLDGIETGAQVNVLEGVQVNGTDLAISSKKVNLVTKTAYNASTNKIATESDLPASITIITTSGSQSVSDGTNTLSFGANAFNSTTIPTSYVSSVNGSTGAVTNIETTTNKVTSLSSASTDTEYPSAKCVYDIIGDVETLLTALNSGSGV